MAAAAPSWGGRQVPAYRNPERPDVRRAVAAPSSARSLNVYQRARLESLVSATAPVTDDTLRILVFQVQFQDSLMGGQPGSNRPQVRDSLWFANEMDHMAQYFHGASRGHFEIEWTIDGTLYTLPNKMSYYGSDTFEDTRVVELAQSTIDFADAGVDFSAFDHVFIIHAGAGQETDVAGDSPIQLWSSFYDLSDIRGALDDPSAGGLATGDSLAENRSSSTTSRWFHRTRRRTSRPSPLSGSGRSRSEAASDSCRRSIRRPEVFRIRRVRAPSVSWPTDCST